EVDEHEQLRRRERLSARAGDGGRVADQLHVVAQQHARHLAVGAATQHDRGVGRAGGDHHPPESLADREHADEHRHDAGDAEHRRGGGAEARGKRAKVEADEGRELSEPAHYSLRSASTALRRMAWNAGHAPVITPSSRTMTMPRIRSRGGKLKIGSAPFVGSPALTASAPRSRPIAPPRQEISSDSASTISSICESVKPIAFSTPSSLIRSRTACAIVLPATRRMVKKTAVRIAVTIAPMLPICSANPLMNAFSVSVLVSNGELANFSSIAFTICSE